MLKTYQHEKDIRKVFDFDYGLWGQQNGMDNFCPAS
jgi:hypothetical protein